MPEENVLEVKEQPGAFFYLMNRIDSVDQKLSTKIDRMDEKIDAKISGLEDKMNVKINDLEDKIDKMRQEFKEEIGKLDEKIDTLRYWATGILVVGFGGVIAAIKL